MWASPDCKHFSKAKGGKPVSKRVRGLAWVVIRWAKTVRPRVICLENVEEFKDLGSARREQHARRREEGPHVQPLGRAL
jgi:DNA (cytosine-5)-methyltransferase 1